MYINFLIDSWNAQLFKMPKDILPEVPFCPKTSCPIWQFAQEDILPKDFLPKLTICPKGTNCPRQNFAYNLEGFCPSVFVLLICIIIMNYTNFLEVSLKTFSVLLSLYRFCLFFMAGLTTECSKLPQKCFLFIFNLRQSNKSIGSCISIIVATCKLLWFYWIIFGKCCEDWLNKYQ